MKRFITATLTLALFTCLSAGKASAGNADVTEELYTAFNFIAGSVPNPDTWQGGSTNLYWPANGLIAIIAIAATEVGLVDSADCPKLGGQEGEEIAASPDRSDFRGCIPGDAPDVSHIDLALGLFFELRDSGFTEDEAFELVEMVMESDLETARPQPISGEATGKVTHLTKTTIKVQQEVGPTTPFLDMDVATVVVDRQGNPATVYKGDRVKVEFTGNHADKITIL